MFIEAPLSIYKFIKFKARSIDVIFEQDNKFCYVTLHVV